MCFLVLESWIPFFTVKQRVNKKVHPLSVQRSYDGRISEDGKTGTGVVAKMCPG